MYNTIHVDIYGVCDTFVARLFVLSSCSQKSETHKKKLRKIETSDLRRRILTRLLENISLEQK